MYIFILHHGRRLSDKLYLELITIPEQDAGCVSLKACAPTKKYTQKQKKSVK